MNSFYRNPEGFRQSCCSKSSRRLRFLMRVSFFYIVLMICSQQFVAAHMASGQGLDKQVTIGAENETLSVLFQKLKGQTGLSFAFPQLDEYPGVTFKVGNRTVREVLDIALEGKKLVYVLKGRTVVIFDEGDLGNKTVSVGEIQLTNAREKVEPSAVITGTVTDASTQQPMAGVNVIVKSTVRGTTTDAQGNFSIDASDNEVLIFSFIGFKSYETQVSGRGLINVPMEVDITALQEVVFKAGYWDVKEKEKTGNISRVSASEIAKQPVNNPLQALQGRMPGVYIQQMSGVPGSTIRMRIRGRSSIDNGNEPLYIIDGVPFSTESLSSTFTSGSILAGGQSPLNSINVSNIESIEVLKDADATAIYGSRGSNGVVIITTKKATPGKTKLNLNLYSGVGTVARKVKLLNTDQYLLMRNEAFDNDDSTPGTSDFDVNGAWDQSRYTDWQDVLIGGSAKTSNVQVSISGGTASTQYIFGGSYLRQTNVFPGDFVYHKASSQFSIVHTSANQKFKTTVSANYVLDKNNLIAQDLTSKAISLPPNAPDIYDVEGNLNWENSTWENPLRYTLQKYQGSTNNLISNAVLSYEVLPDLQIKTSLGFNYFQSKDRAFNPTGYYNPADDVTSDELTSRFNFGDHQSWIVEPQIVWKKNIAKGQLSVLAGLTFQGQVREQLTVQANGFANNALIENIDAASETTVDFYNYIEYKYTAAFGRINYNWEGKYILNVTGRRDGSSRFGPGKQFANFGAIGAAWIFTNEDFLRNSGLLSFGKLRVSYGTTGNDQIADYGFLDTYSPSSDYNSVSGLGPDRLYNANFSWETNRKSEIGLDFGFLKDRISLGLSYYRNRSSSQLIAYKLPLTTGFTSIQANLPAVVQNTGLEVELNSVNLKTLSINWETTFNITIPENKLVEFPDLDASTYTNYYSLGKPLSIRKVYHNLGVDPLTGIYQFEDVNADEVISAPEDRNIVQNVGQKFYGGINNRLTFRGWQLDVFFQFVKQTALSSLLTTGLPGSMRNQPASLLNGRWRNSDQPATLQKFSTENNSTASLAYNNFIVSDASISDASFIRLQNVYIAYQFPEKLTRGIQCRLYLQGQNLLTFTDYDGIDPESQSLYNLPPLRILTIGTQLTF
jgi:TonB-linked SusC/RagA family outer membrane protein